MPNFIAAFFILGIIGLLGIPLDMMTITIAAITIGIAVDNSIHYIYRFKEEFKNSNDYNETIKICHSTVGQAILNTSITIVFGFSILILSKFIPTIYFGLFTGIAMLLAMVSVLTLLPSLLLKIKTFQIKLMIDTLKDFYNLISIIDLIYLIITILSLVKCYNKGFILSILAMSKWLLAYIITLIIFPRTKPYVKDILDNEYILDISLGVGIFCNSNFCCFTNKQRNK